ncbi:glycine cleavage system protein GcvH [Sporosalibacterium faouarense]|uniref:glycine cleavage system protein GcvH n=1 Tax=Sporosalibacterium faouarense TaxID=516123 RepID=UPI00141D1D41|nr:glycine cleavage system protein GcvH [Sporosalibacterium faouarense]MTI49268.1 glycine cleavage system protein GcvH [Bacillota bacterium]
MKVLEGLLYSENHEWVRVEGNKAYLGITDYAQHALGDIVYIELPEEEEEFDAEDSICTIESVKAASDIYTPVSGTVVEINEDLEDDPGAVNADPYENWIVCIELSNNSELEELMSPEEYKEYCEKEE